MNEELLRRAIVELANAFLDQEYAKDTRNLELIKMLADDAWINFALATRPASSAGADKS